MAIGRISGALLFSDLDRQGTDLAFTTNGKSLAFMDFTNFRLGVNTNSIVDTFTVSGTANVSGIAKIYGNLVAASGVQAYDTSTGALVVLGGAGISGNLYAGNLFANNFSGNISNAGGSSIFGNIAVTYAGVFGSLNTANAVITGGYITGLANLAATTAQFTNLSSGNIVISGGYITSLSNISATTGNVESWYATTFNATHGNLTTVSVSNLSTGNAVVSGGYISALTNAYITTSEITNFSTGNAVITGGYIDNLANATITTGNAQSWYSTTTNATEANIITAFVGNFSTANAVISGGFISGLANAIISTANIGNVNFNDVTISSTTGNLVLSPLLTNSNSVVTIAATSALQLPSGSSAQQPSSVYAGAIRWNSSIGTIEVYSGIQWIPLLSQIANQAITPDGVNTNYTLDYSSTEEGIIVSINGTLQQPGSAYTVSGTTITFTEVPLVTDIVSIRFIASGVVENNVNFGNVAANIIPSANVTYDLGSNLYRWRDIWLSGNSIYLGAANITSNGTAIELPPGSSIGGIDLSANLGAYQTFANSNAASQATSINSISANLGAYQTFANSNLGILTSNVTTLLSNAATQQVQLNNIVSTSNANTTAFLPSYSGNIGATLTSAAQPYVTTLTGLTSFGPVTGTTTAQGNLIITGNLTVQGNTITIGSNNLTVVDSIIDLHTPANLQPLISDDGRDIGIRFHYYKGSDDHAFFGWENDTQTLIYLQRSDEVNSNITGTYGNVQFGSLLLSNTTAATSTTTGALQVRGGVGINGALHILNTGDVSANLGAFQTLSNTNAASQATSINSINANIGAYQTFANANVVAIQANIGAFYTYANTKIGTNSNSNLVVQSTTPTTSTTTGALVVVGGVGIAGAAVVAGNVTIGTTALSSRANLYLTGGNLAAAPGSSLKLAEFHSTVTNASYIQFLTQRHAQGADWTTANTRIQQMIDVTPQGYIEFNPNGAQYGVAIGSQNFQDIARFHDSTGNVVIRSTTTSTSTTTGALVVGGGIGVAGNVVIANNLIPNSNISSNVGTPTLWFSNIHATTFRGTSITANYADLAELYLADDDYGEGTVVIFGGSAEITVTSTFADHRVAGVISKNPAYLMNNTLDGLAVALRGRVPVKVIGPVNKGDLLVTAAVSGHAISVGSDTSFGVKIFAKSLIDNSDTQSKVIEAVII